MFETLTQFFNVLIFLDIVLATLCCFLIIKLPLQYKLKYVTIPIVLLITYILIIAGEDVLGRPYDIYPVGKFDMVDYRVVSSGGNKKIEVWVIQKNKSRLLIIPYSAEQEQQLAKSKTKRQKGTQQQGQFMRKGKNSGNGNTDSLEFADKPLQSVLPPKGE